LLTRLETFVKRDTIALSNLHPRLNALLEPMNAELALTNARFAPSVTTVSSNASPQSSASVDIAQLVQVLLLLARTELTVAKVSRNLSPLLIAHSALTVNGAQEV